MLLKDYIPNLDKKYKFYKNKIIKSLIKNKFYSRPLWQPLHSLPQFKKYQKDKLNVTNDLYERCINIPSSIAISTVEIGLFSVPKISIAKTLLIPWENKQNIKANATPGKIDFRYWKLSTTEIFMHFCRV